MEKKESATLKKLKSLKALEKKVYMKWHRDGLADLGLGVLVLLFGLGMKWDQTLLAPIYGCIGYPVWLILKQRITEKRFGYVEFGETRKKREKRGWIILFVLGCVVFLMGIMGYLLVVGDRSGEFGNLPGYLAISAIFAVLTSSVGLVLQLWRLHLYSIIILSMGAAGQILEWHPETGIILPGATIVAIGLALLISFLIKYPKLDPGDEVQQADGGIES